MSTQRIDQLPDIPVTLVKPVGSVSVFASSTASQPFFEQQTISLPNYLLQQTQSDIAHDKTGLILYFYPKDNTTGCSIQAQDFSHHHDEFARLGYQIIGVSRDSIKSHEKFMAAKAINFALISDTDEVLCQYFDVIGEKLMYGKKVQGVVRSTFIFDKMGKRQHAFRNVRAKGHAESVLALLQASAAL